MSSVSKTVAGFALLILSCPRSGATPDHEIRVTERLLGSNSAGFAILRVERDNRGSYYVSSEKHFLDIYEKGGGDDRPDLAEKTSTVLLLRQTYSKDPDAAPDAPPGVNVDEMAEVNEAVSLPKLLERFPRMPDRWTAEKFQRLGAHPTAGVTLNGYSLIWGGWVKERFGADRNDELDWKLEDAAEDSNSLFLKVSTEKQTRWICIPPASTEQVRARLLMKDFYLVAGTFDAEEEAVALARKIIGKRQERKSPRFAPEVWSQRTPAGKVRYRVVSGLTEKAVRGDSFSRLEETLGLELEVTGSSGFGNRIFFK